MTEAVRGPAMASWPWAPSIKNRSSSLDACGSFCAAIRSPPVCLFSRSTHPSPGPSRSPSSPIAV